MQTISVSAADVPVSAFHVSGHPVVDLCRLGERGRNISLLRTVSLSGYELHV